MKPFARSYAIRQKSNIRRPHAASQAYDPGQICAAYNMPTGMSANPMTVVIGELGGKFYPSDVALWAAKAGLPAPTISTYLLPGADDSAGDADGEVALDWQKAAEFYSYITGLPLNIIIVYGPNSGPAFGQVMNYANSLNSVGAASWSWGSPEDSGWATADRTAMDNAAQSAKFPWFAAAGDNDSGDGESTATTDLPAASSYFTGCGGTSRVPSGGAETVWNNGGGEGTGGGFSKVYSQPSWQPSNSQGTGRMVPDVAMVADPNTGYNVVINGQWEVIGGTSAVAPIMAGFMAAVNSVRGKNGLAPIGMVNSALWTNISSYLDITSGNNGAFKATAGPDPCSGLGRPLPTLFAVLTGATTTPPINPPPVNPPSGLTIAQVDAVVNAEFARLEKLNPLLSSLLKQIDADLIATLNKQFPAS